MTQKKKSTDTLHPPSGEYAVVDPCNYTLEFVVEAVAEAAAELHQSIKADAQTFFTSCVKVKQIPAPLAPHHGGHV